MHVDLRSRNVAELINVCLDELQRRASRRVGNDTDPGAGGHVRIAFAKENGVGESVSDISDPGMAVAKEGTVRSNRRDAIAVWGIERWIEGARQVPHQSPG